MYNYAVFIMTHGRANNVKTFHSLRKHGYSGKIYIVIDTDDEQSEKYIENFGKENVLIFDKKIKESKMDTGDIGGSMKCVVFARNKCFEFARELGLDYFIEADDDYTSFNVRKEKNGKLKSIAIKNLDSIFDAMFSFLDDSGALAVAPAQAGDYIGGAKTNGGTIWKYRVKRKCMNLFFCKTSNPFQFSGRINEDVTTYSRLGQIGKLFFTVADWMLIQEQTQKQSGGMTETYLDGGTFLKSFYSVVFSPSCVSIQMMGGHRKGTVGHERIHHRVDWSHCTPMIINEKWKKASTKGGE